MFYLILLHSDSQFLISVMIANRHISLPLFTCLDWLPIKPSPCFGVAKVYLRHRQWIKETEAINWNDRNILLILFLAGQYLRNTCIDRSISFGQANNPITSIWLFIYIELYSKNILLHIIINNVYCLLSPMYQRNIFLIVSIMKVRNKSTAVPQYKNKF